MGIPCHALFCSAIVSIIDTKDRLTRESIQLLVQYSTSEKPSCNMTTRLLRDHYINHDTRSIETRHRHKAQAYTTQRNQNKNLRLQINSKFNIDPGGHSFYLSCRRHIKTMCAKHCGNSGLPVGCYYR